MLYRYRPAAQGCSHELTYGCFELLGHHLTIDLAIGRDRLTIGDQSIDRALCDEGLDVRQEVEIAVPGNQRPMLTAHRNALLAGIADRHWLDQNLVTATLGIDCAKQRGSEWQ